MHAELQEFSTVEEAIKSLELTSLRVVLVVDSNKRLIGIITDGDIRRGFIKGCSLRSPVSQILNSEPITVAEGVSTPEIHILMEKHKIQHLPVIDRSMKVVGLFILDKRPTIDFRFNRVVIMAGGKGIRMRPLTENTPKPMVPIAGKPLLEHVIERFKQQGFFQFTICVSYLAELITNYFMDGAKWDIEIEYLYEELPLGTAGSLRNLRKFEDLPFIVTNSDVISEIDIGDLIDFHIRNRAAATMAIRPYEIQNQFGVVETNGAEISAIIEKPIYRSHISTGVYVFEPNVVNMLPDNDVIQIPELFDHLRILGHRTLAFHVQDKWIDLARQADIEKVNSRNSIFWDRKL
jgi:dTDP-glucose pyrophosphorylase